MIKALRLVVAAALVLLAPGEGAYAAVARVAALKPGSFGFSGSRLPALKTGPSAFTNSLKTSAFGLSAVQTAGTVAGPTVGEKLGVLGSALAPELEIVASAATSQSASLSAGRRIWNLFYGGKDARASGVVSVRLSDEGSGGGLKKSAQELADLVNDPPAAVFLDYDGTLTDRSEGVSLPTPPETIAAIVRLLEAGLPVAIVTGRSFDRQPEGTKIGMEVWSVLLSKIPAALRRNLFFSGRNGGELVQFDAQGSPVRVLDGQWTEDEKTKTEAAVAAALVEAGIGAGEAELIRAPGQTNTVFKENDPRADAYAKILQRKFTEAGIRYPVTQNHNWVHFNRSQKEDGVKFLYAAMVSRGFELSPSSLLFVGDELRMNPGKPAGGDASMALSFPLSRAVSVGDAAGDLLPRNARLLRERGTQGALRVMEAVLQGLAAQPKKTAPLLSRPAVRETTKALAVAAYVWALTHPAFAAIAGTVALTVLGVPQLVKNFREGASAVKDLVLSSTLIWLAASVFLTMGAALKGSHAAYLVGNVAGIVQASIMLWQILRHQKAPGMRTKTLVVAGALSVASAVVLALGGMGAFSWATLGGWSTLAAIVLLFGINFPQIARYYRLYEKEGRAPSGVSPLYPGLVAGGSLFHLIAALSFGDGWWAFNAFVAILTSGFVLAQLYFPKQAHAALKPFKPAARALRRLKTRLRWWARLYARG